MRTFRNDPGLDSASRPESTLGNPESGANDGRDGLLRMVDALDSALAAVQDRVSRLETDVRNLQSQHANRS